MVTGKRRRTTNRPSPLRVLFVSTSLPVGGAETLLVNLVRRLDRSRLTPELCCLKEPGPLGELLAGEIPVHSRLLSGKYDVRVLPRLCALLRRRHIDAVVTIGAGDKLFWGRLGARLAGCPVVISALHATGWPDEIGRLNRWLTRLTDAFVAVAQRHGAYLVDVERLPSRRVRVIPNGVDADRFRPEPNGRLMARRRAGLPAQAPVVGIVAALRPEKNHRLFLDAAARLLRRLPDARFVVVGDGPERAGLETTARSLGLHDAVLWLGTRSDVPELLRALDVFTLTSTSEASPVSILEAMASGLPVVASDIGSVSESVRCGETGLLVPSGDASQFANDWHRLLTQPELARRFGAAGRQEVLDHWSLDAMVRGYERLVEEIFEKASRDT